METLRLREGKQPAEPPVMKLIWLRRINSWIPKAGRECPQAEAWLGSHSRCGAPRRVGPAPLLGWRWILPPFHHILCVSGPLAFTLLPFISLIRVLITILLTRDFRKLLKELRAWGKASQLPPFPVFSTSCLLVCLPLSPKGCRLSFHRRGDDQGTRMFPFCISAYLNQNWPLWNGHS